MLMFVLRFKGYFICSAVTDEFDLVVSGV